MRRSIPSFAIGLGAAFALLSQSGCAQRTAVAESSRDRPAVLMECNQGRTNCREAARYSTLEICHRERANYVARNPLREAYCTTHAAAKR